jgi:hypothetical protein
MGSNPGGGVGSRKPSISVYEVRLALLAPKKDAPAPAKRRINDSFLFSGRRVAVVLESSSFVAVSMAAVPTELRTESFELKELEL